MREVRVIDVHWLGARQCKVMRVAWEHVQVDGVWRKSKDQPMVCQSWYFEYTENPYFHGNKKLVFLNQPQSQDCLGKLFHAFKHLQAFQDITAAWPQAYLDVM